MNTKKDTSRVLLLTLVIVTFMVVSVVLYVIFFGNGNGNGNGNGTASAKISANIEVPATIFGYSLLGGYSFNYVTLDGYYPNTTFGISIPFSLFNGNTVYTEVDAYCSPKANGNYTLVSSGSVASVFPSFSLPYSKTVNVTVPNIPANENCLFRVYLKNSNGQIISTIFNTGITLVSLDTPAQTFS